MLEESAKEPSNNATQENTTEKQQQTAQEHPNKQSQTDRECTSAANTRQKLNSTISGRNRTATENRAKQTTKPDNLSTTKDKDEREEENFDVAGMLSASQQREFPLSPCVLTTVIPETPIMVIEEIPISQIDREGNKEAIPAAKRNIKSMETNKKKVGTQSRMTRMFNPLSLRHPPVKF